VLTRYSSSTPFSFRKENYVTLQQENDGAFPRSLLTLLNVHPASSSRTRQHFDGYRAITSIPINRARISAVIAYVSLSGALVKPITSDLHGFTARTLPAQRTAVARATISDDRQWSTSTSLDPEHCHLGRGRNTEVQPLMGAHCKTPTPPTCRQVEPDVTLTDANPTPRHRGRDTAVLLPKGAHGRTSTLSTHRQVEPDVVPTETNPTLMHREKDTAMLLLKGAHGRTLTLPTHRHVKPDVSHAEASSTPQHKGRDTAVLLPKGAHYGTPTLRVTVNDTYKVVPAEANDTPLSRTSPSTGLIVTIGKNPLPARPARGNTIVSTSANDGLPRDTNLSVNITITSSDSPRSMRRERDTAVLLLKGAHGRTPTLPTHRQVEPDVVHADVNPTPIHRGRDSAGLLLKGAHCRTLTQAEPNVLPADSLRDAQAPALAPASTTAPAISTALSPTKAAADGKP
jgi:hypothetical protein